MAPSSQKNNESKTMNLNNTEIRALVEDEMEKLLQISNTANDEKAYKTSTDLLTECTNCGADDAKIDIYTSCESIKRIIVILKGYSKLLHIHCNKLSKHTPLSEILTFKNIYSLTQITNDFIHIKDHMDRNKNDAKHLATKFREELKCINTGHRRLTHSNFANFEDNLLQQQCDKMYSYLTHINDIPPMPFVHYVGKKKDDQWWGYDVGQSNESIYSHLVQKMNIFRWQSAHGFNSKQHHCLMHLRAKYKNIKEEVLQNGYYSLSKDNWNQTLRKANVFFNSFARLRIKTTYAGKYDDTISQEMCKWRAGETIGMAEIVTFKLYTDWDKLQYELKKCFRFETVSDIFTLNDSETAAGNELAFTSNERDLQLLLEHRLRTFYWWRIKLLTVLSKYSKKLDRNTPLYHGVNSKMILNNHRQMIGFCGPLSTSSSYHVARTFATAKGMVLEVTTQYPRLAMCRAFDVSLLSDYPEEKEQLVSFAYLRITKVFTRPLDKNWQRFDDIDNYNECNVALSSITRSIFFAVHLFRQQIFSMSVHSEYWLSAFLYLYAEYNELSDNRDNGHIKKTKFVDQLKQILMNVEYKQCESMDDCSRHRRILRILWQKFDNFRKYSNRQQVVKIDRISENLKAYFMDYVGLDIYGKEKYAISIEKIVKIFPNVKEIHFINTYYFDDGALNKLLQYIHSTAQSTLKNIKFLYYDYLNAFDGVQLDEKLLNRLEDMKWQIKAKQIGKTGFEIRVFANGKLAPHILRMEQSLSLASETTINCIPAKDLNSNTNINTNIAQKMINSVNTLSSNSLCCSLFSCFIVLLLVIVVISTMYICMQNNISFIVIHC